MLRSGETLMNSVPQNSGEMRRRPGLRHPLSAVLLLSAVVAAIFAAPAGAIVVQTSDGPISYQPRAATANQTRAPGLNATAASGGALIYHGGPVMPSNTTYALFWEPSGHSLPADYKSAIAAYLGNVAADSGLSTNVYSVGTQYTDSSGSRAAYDSTFGGSLDDTDAYPGNGCKPGSSPKFTVCLTDTQLSDELDSYIGAHPGLPRGLGAMYFIVLPSAVDTCFDATATDCFSSTFCAYHSNNNTGGATLYADIPFIPFFPEGCDPGQSPNGNSADQTLSGLSHEHNETVTDPLGTAWFDHNGDENADKCIGTYGPALGGASGAESNQLINGGPYFIQEEWGNGVDGCEQRNALPTAAFSPPASPHSGQPAVLDGSPSSDPDGSIAAYSWSFGDGGTAGSAVPAHTFAAPGSYQVTLTVTDNNGFTSSAAETVLVTSAPNHFILGKLRRNKVKGTARLPVTVPGPGTLTLSGKGIVPRRPARRARAVSRATEVSTAGTVNLLIKARGRVKTILNKKGKVKVKIRVTFTPAGGVAAGQARSITLRKKRPR